MRLPEPDLGVDAVRPHVDIVPVRQVPLLESRVVVAPLLRQPSHRRGRQAGRGAEELLQRGHEVPAGQAVQVEERQDLGDLRGLTAPRRKDLGREPLPLAGLLVDAQVVHPGRGDLDRASRSDHGPGPVMAVADYQTVPMLVPLACQLGYVLVDFRFQRGGEHPARALADDLVDQGAGLGGAVFGDYAEHGRAFPTRAATRANSMTVKGSSGRYALRVPPADPQVLSIARSVRTTAPYAPRLQTRQGRPRPVSRRRRRPWCWCCSRR